MSAEPPFEISPDEVKRMLDAGEPVRILDVRNPEEHAIGHIAGATLMPMNDVPARLRELDDGRPIVVHCKMGGRASQVTAFLRQHGLPARNMTGGILAWAERIDPRMPTY